MSAEWEEIKEPILSVAHWGSAFVLELIEAA